MGLSDLEDQSKAAQDSTNGDMMAEPISLEVTCAASSPTTDKSLNASTHSVRPIIQNVVATSDLGLKLDLRSIALKALNAEFNPKRFSAVVLRMREPRSTAMLFSSGKMVVTGLNSEKLSRLSCRRFARVVSKVVENREDVKLCDYGIQNIVASCNVHFQIDLIRFSVLHYRFCTYEPELFPALVYKVRNPKVTVLVFHTGKVVLAGAKSTDDISQAFDLIYPTLQQFRRVQPMEPL